MKILLVDDLREIDFIKKKYGVEVTHVARSYSEAIHLITNFQWDVICMDHDLASYDEAGLEKTGVHVLNYIEENIQFAPKAFLIVSDNPVGRKNMAMVIDSINKRALNEITSQ